MILAKVWHAGLQTELLVQSLLVLYFDKNDPNKAYVNIQHPTDGVDRLIQICAVAPVPEPETYAMMIAGLGMLGAVARCRKQK